MMSTWLRERTFKGRIVDGRKIMMPYNTLLNNYYNE